LKPLPIDLKNGMKTRADTDRPKNRPPHLTYSAFCLAAKDRTTGFLKWISATKSAHCLCPVKQKRALLESNPPRDSWIERRRNTTASTFGEAKTSPKATLEPFISEPEHAFQKLTQHCLQELEEFSSSTLENKNIKKNYLSSYPFFRGKPSDRFYMRKQSKRRGKKMEERKRM
jgi:hypothetical protein